jgi:hypothetical protein
MCQGLTQSYQGLLAIQFLMGIVETGLPAGAGLLLGSYYRKKELSFVLSCSLHVEKPELASAVYVLAIRSLCSRYN